MEQFLTKMTAVGLKCLSKAEILLDNNQTLDRRTIKQIHTLIDRAFKIGALNLQYRQQVRSRSSGRVSWGPPSGPQEGES